MYHWLKQYDCAISDFSEAIRLAPDSGGLYIFRGLAYNKSGDTPQGNADYNKAVVLLSAAIDLNPKDAASLKNRGDAYRLMGQYGKSIVDYSEAIKTAPDDYRIYMDRGITYCWTKDYSRALNDLDEAIRLNPNSGNAYTTRSICYNAIGKACGFWTKQRSEYLALAKADGTRWRSLPFGE